LLKILYALQKKDVPGCSLQAMPICPSPRRDCGTFTEPPPHKLKEPTYHKYKKIWKQLLCFLYPLVWQKQAPVLHCNLTPAQTIALDAVIRKVVERAEQQEPLTDAPKTAPEHYQELDRG